MGMIEEHSINVGPFRISLGKVYGVFYKISFMSDDVKLAEIPISIDLLTELKNNLESTMRWWTNFSYDFPVQNTLGEYYTLAVGSNIDCPTDDIPGDPVYLELYSTQGGKTGKILGSWVEQQDVFNIRLLIESFVGGA